MRKISTPHCLHASLSGDTDREEWRSGTKICHRTFKPQMDVMIFTWQWYILWKITAGDDSRIRVWDLKMPNTPLHELPGHQHWYASNFYLVELRSKFCFMSSGPCNAPWENTAGVLLSSGNDFAFNSNDQSLLLSLCVQDSTHSIQP